MTINNSHTFHDHDDFDDDFFFNDPEILEEIDKTLNTYTKKNDINNNDINKNDINYDINKNDITKNNINHDINKNNINYDITKNNINHDINKNINHDIIDLVSLQPSFDKSNFSAFSRIPHELQLENLDCWIFPVNYPKRNYQFNIVKSALFQNTLVSLPTGLGKTFIAAVLMFNYWRWFKTGKIVFMAPTKPLVSQQLEACFKITGLSQLDTCELTGALSPSLRAAEWKEKRVFFLTPQSFKNDLDSKLCDPRDFVCIVIDEAHRALGNYAYCECIRLIYAQNPFFRVLALSATPGTDANSVQNVVTNLNISKIEIRTEEAMDIREYIHSCSKETIIVFQNDILKSTQAAFSEIIRFYLGKMVKLRAFHETDPEKVTKFGLIQSRTQWKIANANHPLRGVVEADFSILISLSHALDLLLRHGITPFYRYLSNVLDMGDESNGSLGSTPKSIKGQLKKNSQLMNLLTDLQTTMKSPSFIGHPKLERMESIVLSHFTEHQKKHVDDGESTRVMVFSEYRDSVDEIVNVLQKHDPLIRVMAFVGQGTRNGKAFSQKEQIKVIKNFQDGGYNVLVATCIGEEGLDIGEVDLIICFDAQSSPIRMLQRMGRTGRKRKGKIITLVAHGKEEHQFQKVQASYKKVQNILTGGKLKMFQEDERLIPKVFKPIAKEVVLVIPEYLNQKDIAQKKSSSSSLEFDTKKKLIKEVSPVELIFTPTEWRIYNSLYRESEPCRKLDFTKKTHWQTSVHKSNIGKTKLSQDYVKLISDFERIRKDNVSEAEWYAMISEKANEPLILPSDTKRKVEVFKTPAIPRHKKRRVSFLEDEGDLDYLPGFLHDDLPNISIENTISSPIFTNTSKTPDKISPQESKYLTASPETPVLSQWRQSLIKPSGELSPLFTSYPPTPIITKHEKILNEKKQSVDDILQSFKNSSSAVDSLNLISVLFTKFDQMPEFIECPDFENTEKQLIETPFLQNGDSLTDPIVLQTIKKDSTTVKHSNFEFDDDDDFMDIDLKSFDHGSISATKSEVLNISPKIEVLEKIETEYFDKSVEGLESWDLPDEDFETIDPCNLNPKSVINDIDVGDFSSFDTSDPAQPPPTTTSPTQFVKGLRQAKLVFTDTSETPSDSSIKRPNHDIHECSSPSVSSKSSFMRVNSPPLVKRIKPKFDRKLMKHLIDVEAEVDDDDNNSDDFEEDTDYASSLNGFIRFSEPSSCSSTSFHHRHPTQKPQTSKYKMKFLGEIPLSQKLNAANNHVYKWQDGAFTDDSFVCSDSHVDFETQNSAENEVIDIDDDDKE